MEQTTKKTNKKKLVVALALLALIVVASVITTVVLVLAQNQQTVKSNVNVTYSVTDVSATVAGKYTVKGSAAKDMDPASITINPSDTTASPMDVPTTIALSATNNYVVFEYKFTNNTYTAADDDDAAAGTFNGTTANPFTVGVTYTDDINVEGAESPIADVNTTVLYKSSAAPITAFEDENVEDWATSLAQTTCNAVTYVYIRVSITNTSLPATFSGQFNFVLTSVASQSQG